MTDPIAARRPRPAPNSLLLKAAVVLPGVAIASLLWLVIIAALPPVVGFGVTVAGLAVAAVLAAGHGEDLTVQLHYRARRATPTEPPRLAVAWRLATHDLDADGVRLRIVTSGPPVGTAGRRHLLLRRDVVDAYRTNQITARQVAGLITDGVGRLHHGHTLVVGAIAVILETQAGRWPSPIIIAVFIALSYLMPLFTRAWEQHVGSVAAVS